MRNRGLSESENKKKRARGQEAKQVQLPVPSASYRRRAWVQFQRALDPLARIKPLPPPRP
jgi:hypothetical protein